MSEPKQKKNTIVTESGNFEPEILKKAHDKHIKNWPKGSEPGYPIHYARFHQPVPPAKDMEPVGEFRIQEQASKYKVDSLRWTTDGVMYCFRGETGMVPLANVVYCRLTL